MWKWMLLTTVVACAPAEPEPEPDPAPPEPARLSCPEAGDARFDALAAALEGELPSFNAPGVAAALMLDGELVWCAGIGAKDAAGSEPMGPNTLMRIGSLTKALTAVALLQEVQEGTLDLDASLTETLGEDWRLAAQPSLTDSLRVEHLLTHEAGLFDYLEIDASGGDGALAQWTDGFLLDYLWFMAPPGSFFNYSNTNYTLAGRLIEHGSGQHYGPRMDSLFESLGMERTFFDGSAVTEDGDYALGSSVGAGGQLMEAGPTSYDNPWGRPAGFAWSSVEDLANLARFFMEGDERILDGALRENMMKPHVDMQGIPGLSHYGHGLMVQEGVFLGSDFHAFRWITHGGALPGFSAEIHMIPDQGFALITLANGEGAYFTDALVEAFQSFVELPAPSTPPDLTAPDPTLYEGSYLDPYNVGPMHFAVDEDTFTVHMPLLDDLEIPYEPEILPLYGDSFLMQVQGFPMELTFIRDEGELRWARTRSFVGDNQLPQQVSATPGQAPKASLHPAPLPLDPAFRLWLRHHRLSAD